MHPMRPISLVFMAAVLSLNAQPAPKAPPATKKEPTRDHAAPAPKQEDDQSETLQHVKYVYRPNLTRDPFSSPTDNLDQNRAETIDEVGILGWISVRGKQLVIVSDSRGKTRQLPVGYRFRDGEIVSISEKAVTFRQWDPTATTRTGKIVEKLFKRKEGKQ